MVDTHERRRRARDEDAKLVEEVVEGVKVPVLGERGGLEREQQRRRDALVDGVLGHIDHEQREHIRDHERPRASQVRHEGPAVAAFRMGRVGRGSDGGARGQQAGRGVAGRHVVDVVLGQVPLRKGLVALEGGALAQGPLREDDEEAQQHDGGQECGGQQAVPDAETHPGGEHHVQARAGQSRAAGAAPPSGKAHVAVVVGQAEEAQLAAAAAQAGEHDAQHLDGDGAGGRRERDEEHPGGGEAGEYGNAHGVGDAVDKVGGDELGHEGGHHVGKEDDALGQVPDEVLRGGQDDHVEDIVDEAYCEGKQLAHARAHIICLCACTSSRRLRARTKQPEGHQDVGVGVAEDAGDPRAPGWSSRHG